MDKAEILYGDALETLDMALATEGSQRLMLLSVAICIRDHAERMRRDRQPSGPLAAGAERPDR